MATVVQKKKKKDQVCAHVSLFFDTLSNLKSLWKPRREQCACVMKLKGRGSSDNILHSQYDQQRLHFVYSGCYYLQCCWLITFWFYSKLVSRFAQRDINPYFPPRWRQRQVVARLLGFHNPFSGADPQAEPLSAGMLFHSHTFMGIVTSVLQREIASTPITRSQVTSSREV